jgi:hypothetical protein
MPEHSEDAPDWPQQATATVVDFVDNVKHKTTRPAMMATRGVVYGIVMIAIGLPAVVMLLVGLVHFLDHAIPQEVWLVYLILGTVFTLAGLLLWRKRTA